MKKKLLTVLMTAVLTLSSAMTAFATNPSVQAPQFEILSAVDKDGKAMNDCHEIRMRAVEEKDRASVENMKSNLQLVLGNRYVEGLQAVMETDVCLFDEVDGEVHWTDGDYHFPVTITFSVPGVTKDSVVRVLHGYDGRNGSTDDSISLDEWHEETQVVVGENTITVTFAHLSPVVFFVQGGTSAGTGTGTGGSTVTSPVTGENNTVVYAAVIAVVAIAGAAVSKKKHA